MAQPSLKAEFFVRSDGVCVPKAQPLTVSEKRRVYERDGAACRFCGIKTRLGGGRLWSLDCLPSAQIDHIFPRARGGQNDDLNLQLLCQPCNSQKGNKTPEEFSKYLKTVKHLREGQRGAY